MAYVVTATWTAKEGEVERVLAAIRKLVEPSRAEPGCRFYQSRCPLLEPRGSTAQRLSQLATIRSYPFACVATPTRSLAFGSWPMTVALMPACRVPPGSRRPGRGSIEQLNVKPSQSKKAAALDRARQRRDSARFASRFRSTVDIVHRLAF